MNLNKIYFVINQILDSYIVEGIKPEQLLSYLNADEENYKFLYNKIYRKLNLDNIQFESKELTECLQDSVRDKVAMLNDIQNVNESAATERKKTMYTTLNAWKHAVLDSGSRYKLVSASDYRNWYAFNDDNNDEDGFFKVTEYVNFTDGELMELGDLAGTGYVYDKK